MGVSVKDTGDILDPPLHCLNLRNVLEQKLRFNHKRTRSTYVKCYGLLLKNIDLIF